MRVLLQSLLVAVGAALVAIAFNWFFMPYHLVSGGLGGIALLLSQMFGWSMGLQVLVYNIPVLWGAQKYLGRKFLVLTVVGIGSLTVFLTVLPIRPAIADDPMLNAIFGGILAGAGTALALRGGGSLGGVDPLLVALNRRYSLPIGDVSLVINGAIVALSGMRGDLKSVLYTLAAMFVTGKVIDLLTAGTVKKTVMVVTSRTEEVARNINLGMVRGVTVLDGKGAYSGESRSVLLCVVTRYELGQIREIVLETDPAAFMAVLETDSVTGSFRPHNPLVKPAAIEIPGAAD